MPLIDVPTVHAVTDTPILVDSGFRSRARAVFEALGVHGAVHLRGAGIEASHLYSLALDLAPLQDVTGCRLVINDRVDVAVAAGAWGAQITHRSIALDDACRIAPQLHLGASIHTVEEAKAALELGADWLIAGNVYPTPSHPGKPGRGEEFISNVAKLGGRVIAIGGIPESQVPSLKSRGAHGVAAISGIWLDRDPGAAAARYL